MDTSRIDRRAFDDAITQLTKEGRAVRPCDSCRENITALNPRTGRYTSWYRLQGCGVHHEDEEHWFCSLRCLGFWAESKAPLTSPISSAFQYPS